MPLFDRDGKLYDHDDGVRPDSTVEKLAKLKPVFERPYGKVTRRQQLADHRRRRLGDPGVRGGGASSTASSRAP